MLPLDTVWVVERDGKQVSILKKEKALEIALHTLRQVRSSAAGLVAATASARHTCKDTASGRMRVVVCQC